MVLQDASSIIAFSSGIAMDSNASHFILILQVCMGSCTHGMNYLQLISAKCPHNPLKTNTQPAGLLPVTLLLLPSHDHRTTGTWSSTIHRTASSGRPALPLEEVINR